MAEVVIEEVDALPVPAANIVFVVLAHIGGPLMSFTKPDHAREQAPTLISIADNVDRVRGGDTIRYEITVTNPSPVEAPVTVWLTLPPAVVTGIEAHEAAVIANAVAWKQQLAGGERRAYVVTGTVDPAVSTPDLSATACMKVGADSTCISTGDRADTPASTRRLSWIAAIVFGLLAVAGALWLHRRIRPEQLTPANADGQRPET